MALNKVQQDFINNAARPHMETLVRILHALDTYAADYDALQSSSDALTISATILDDAGASPRDDAPQLSGADLKTMKTLSTAMSAVINAGTKNVLISKMVRNLNTVLKVS